MAIGKNHVSIAVAVLLAGVVGFALGRNTDLTLRVDTPKGSVRLDVAGGAIDYLKLLTDLAKNRQIADVFLTWAADSLNAYSLNDPRLAAALETKACGSIPESPLIENLNARTACAEVPANRSLRDLVKRRGRPFHPIGVRVRVSTPAREHWPSRGEVRVCHDELLGETLQLFSPRSNLAVIVHASGRLPCGGITGIGTEMHLHPQDMAEVLGYEPTGVDSLYAVIAPRR